MRVLIVDDSKTIRNIQKGILAQLGHDQVEEAADGQDALSKAIAFDPELVLVDWNMPIMNGIDFVRAFRASGRQTPVVMVTTEAEKARVVEAVQAGVNGYVVKPFTPEVLEQKIKEIASKFKAAA